MNYNFEVMLPEMADAYQQTSDPNLVNMARAFTGFLSYNLLREPDGAGYMVNVAPSTRTSARWYDEVRPDPDRTALNWTFIRQVPLLSAFLTAREDLAEARAAWARSTEPVTPLAKQDTSPRILTHGLYDEGSPADGSGPPPSRTCPTCAPTTSSNCARTAARTSCTSASPACTWAATSATAPLSPAPA